MEREDFETVKLESPFGRVGLVACDGSVCFEGAAAPGMVCVSQSKKKNIGSHTIEVARAW